MNLTKRRWINYWMLLLIHLVSVVAIVPLILVFIYLLQKGWSGLNWDFFTALPKPVGELGGGMSNALIGSGILVLQASLVGIPLGIAIGIYLSEFGKGVFATILRFAVDLFTSVPSIVVGLFAYALIVKPLRGFSAHAGAFALFIIMLPVIARTTEEILKLIPNHIREAGLALGMPRWKMILSVVLRGSLSGVLAGVILSISRVAGETAPLLFTAFNNRFHFRGLGEPIASLPVQIYTYATSPYEDWHRQAWAGALVLVFLVFILNVLTRFYMKRRYR